MSEQCGYIGPWTGTLCRNDAVAGKQFCSFHEIDGPIQRPTRKRNSSGEQAMKTLRFATLFLAFGVTAFELALMVYAIVRTGIRWKGAKK